MIFLEFLAVFIACENFRIWDGCSDNEVSRPIQPSNSLGGRIWSQIWHMWPKLHMTSPLFWLFGPLLNHYPKFRKERRNWQISTPRAAITLRAAGKNLTLCPIRVEQPCNSLHDLGSFYFSAFASYYWNDTSEWHLSGGDKGKRTAR